MGKAWHALLERADQLDGTSPPERVGTEFGLNREQVREVIDAARRVGETPQLSQFFGPQIAAWNELELIDAAGDSVRIDRLVELSDAVWILDYKWRCTASERGAYDRQLARYAAVVASLRPGRRIRAALVLADGSLLETDVGSAH
jgi:ATP-dependent helicase/nuclease subunit A